MSSPTTLLGRWGEAQVAEYLHKKGYRLIASGYRCRLGEIDLIARKGKELAFVEVKLRRDARFAAAREQVPPAKQRRIVAAAQFFLAEHPECGEYRCRFDVAEVYAPEGVQTQRPDIRYYEHAFW